MLGAKNLTVGGNNASTTYTGEINGTGGSLTKAGTGTLLLNSTTSNFSGGTIINAGQLRIASNAALGNSSGSITLNGGVLLGNNTNPQVGNAGGVNISSAREVIVNAGGGGIGAHGNNNFTTTGKLSGSGTLTFTDVGGAGGRALNFNATNNTFTGRLVIPSNSMTLQINSLGDAAGAGNIALELGSNGTTSTFTYGTGASSPLTLNHRAIEINATSALVATISNLNTTRALTINTDLVATGGGLKTLTLHAASGPGNVFAGKIVNGTNGGTIALTKSGAGTWTLSGTNTYSGTTTISAGTLEVGNAGTLGSGNYSGAISNAGTLKINSSANQILGGAITGAGALVKDNAGVLTLTNTNSFSGGTTVNGGTLLVNGSLAAGSAVSVSNNATLGGAGTIGRAVTVAGSASIAPGASIESLASGALTMGSGTSFKYEAANNTAVGADVMIVGGALSLNGVFLDLAGADLDADAWRPGNKLTLLSYTGSAITSGFTGMSDDAEYFFGTKGWTLNYNDLAEGFNYASEVPNGANYLTLTLTTVPEPTVLSLLGFAGLTMLRRRRAA